MGITVHGCHFQLSNVGQLRLPYRETVEQLFQTIFLIPGRAFVRTAIETITDNVRPSPGVQYVRTPMIATVANNTFRYGVAFAQQMLVAEARSRGGVPFLPETTS